MLKGHSVLTITLRELVTNFKTRVAPKGKILAAHLEAIKKPFAPNDSIVLHGEAHLIAHRVHQERGEAISPSAQYTYLAESLAFCGLFTKVLEDYEIKDDDEKTFDTLLESATRHTMMKSFIEASQRGYANNAQVSTGPAQTQLDLMQAQLTAVALTVERALAATGTVPAPAAAVPAAQGRRAATPAPPHPTHYCWTHGHNFSHNGDVDPATGLLRCNFPKRGHRPDATATNTLKGSKYVWRK